VRASCSESADRDGAPDGRSHRHPARGRRRERLDVASTLVRDAGFDPVIVGKLTEAKRFDVGTKVYNTGMSGPDLRKALGV
jgi:predicted dinucleotide-binding enzyme